VNWTLPEFEYELDHIGVAVNSLDEATPFYQSLGFHSACVEEVPREKVKVAMYELGNQCRIELLEATHPESPIARFLQKKGPGIHHICLRVKDLESTLGFLKENHVKLINDKPQRGAHNCWVAFVHPHATKGVLIELSQPEETKGG